MPRKKTERVDESIRNLYLYRADMMLERMKSKLARSVDDQEIAFYAEQVRHWANTRHLILTGAFDEAIQEEQSRRPAGR